jgi:murein DD-endopeptidase MepM/ murein hydrolase activator NlpD
MARIVKLVICLVAAAVAFPVLALAAATGGNSGADLTCDPATGEDGGPLPGGWDEEQLANTATILSVGHDEGVPQWGWVIALATAITESGLRNLPHLGQANDHDSIGLFQQRPSQGWGTPQQLADPAYQAGKFYDALLAIDGWDTMTLSQAAQAVQRSAIPDAYAAHTTDAVRLVAHLGVPLGHTTLVVNPCVTVSEHGWTQPVHGTIVSRYGARDGRLHAGTDIAAPRHTIIRAAAFGTVTQVRCNAIDRTTGQDWGCHRDGNPHNVAGCGWYVDIAHPGDVTTRYCHLQAEPWISIGDPVIAGQPIGTVGSTGHSSGPHLHYEVILGDSVGQRAIDPEPWMEDRGAKLG